MDLEDVFQNPTKERKPEPIETTKYFFCHKVTFRWPNNITLWFEKNRAQIKSLDGWQNKSSSHISKIQDLSSRL
jgi:hypothetical protein